MSWHIVHRGRDGKYRTVGVRRRVKHVALDEHERAALRRLLTMNDLYRPEGVDRERLLEKLR